MYNELYYAWRREVDEASLGSLPPDFYVRIASYLKRIKEENVQLDKKSVKVDLLELEASNVALMLEQLLRARYKKLLDIISQNQKVPSELLTIEEAKMCEGFAAFTNVYQKFSKDLLQGQTSQVPLVQPPTKSEPEIANKRIVVRFVKSIPAIIGADMKPYGPFRAEDTASLPAENVKVLAKQGLAVQVEVS